MISEKTKELIAYLRKKDIKCAQLQVKGSDKVSAVLLYLSGKNYQKLRVIIMLAEPYAGVCRLSMRCTDVCAFPEGRTRGMLRTMNDLNRMYRDFKCVERDGKVTVMYAGDTDGAKVGEWTHLMLIRLAVWLEMVMPVLNCAASGN